MPDRPRVYLAGPDVFLANAREIGAAKVAHLDALSLEGVFPLDEAPDVDGLAPAEAARRIGLTCEAMMRSCDAALANITPFRGVSMDSGTAYEIGFMRALAKPVAGYTADARDYAERARLFRQSAAAGAFAGFDRPNADIEDFGETENLMITTALHASGLPVTRAAPNGASRGSDGASNDPTAGRIAGFDAFDQAARQLARLLLVEV